MSPCCHLDRLGGQFLAPWAHESHTSGHSPSSFGGRRDRCVRPGFPAPGLPLGDSSDSVCRAEDTEALQSTCISVLYK